MSTLKNLSLIALTCFTLSARADWVIDSSGEDGRNGSNGNDGAGSGADGGDAGKSSAGRDANKIDIWMADRGNGNIVIEGSHSRSFNVGHSGKIILRANGGKGGKGGNGGDGARGRTGTSGRNATQTSRGTDGGPGGRGGDGGDGTSGSNGGDGGTITVRVKEKDMHLLYLLETPEVRGGQGGAGGRNGSAGPGGFGGSGGSSHSWTTSHRVNKTCTRTKSKPSGNGANVTVTYTEDCSYTETEHHSMPGGSTGFPGSSGSSGNASISSGRAGSNGSYRYLVEYSDGRVEEYKRPYNLVLRGFALESEFNDTFAEPGEQISISKIEIANVGGMPSPTLSKIKIASKNDESRATEKHTTLEIGSIPAGGRIVITNPITQVISRRFLTPNQHKQEVKIGLSGEIQGIHRFFDSFDFAIPLTIQYPVSFSRLLGKSTVPMGSTYLFRWSVNNHSQRAMGGVDTMDRKVKIEISYASINGKIEKKDLVIDSGLTTQEVNEIGPNLGEGVSESTYLSAKIGFGKDAEPFEKAKLTITLKVQDAHDPNLYHIADVKEHTLTVGRPYRHNLGAELLIVANPTTTTREIKAWQDLAQLAGRTIDILDSGMQGALDLNSPELAGKYPEATIVILNNDIEPSKETLYADSLLRQTIDSNIQAIQDQTTNFLILDSSGSYHSVAGQFEGHQRVPTSPALVVASVKEDEIHSEEFILSDENLLNVAMTSSFEKKLKWFRKLAIKPEGHDRYIQALSRAIVQDLAFEQASLRSKSAPWIFFGDDYNERELPLLTYFSGFELIAPVDGSQDSVYENPITLAVLEMVANIRFICESRDGLGRRTDQVISGRTNQILAPVITELFNARDGGIWTSDAEEAGERSLERTDEWMKKRLDTLEESAEKLEEEFVDNDHTRTIKFPRKWMGEYYRKATYRMILGPSFERVYTEDPAILSAVLENRMDVHKN